MEAFYQMKKTEDNRDIYTFNDDHGQTIKGEYVIIPVQVWEKQPKWRKYPEEKPEEDRRVPLIAHPLYMEKDLEWYEGCLIQGKWHFMSYGEWISFEQMHMKVLAWFDFPEYKPE